MLKKCYGLVLGLVVLAGSACVTPTHASSASIVITNIRAGSQVSAQEEGVVLYNNSSSDIDITNWCLANKLLTQFACFTPRSQFETSILPAYSYATVISSKVEPNTTSSYSLMYDSSASSSGTIVASSDTISLLDATGRYIDQFTWSSSIASTQQWSRTKLSLLPDLFIDTDSAIDWQKVLYSEFPASQLHYRINSPDTPPDDPSEEPEEPTEQPGDGNSSPEPEDLLPLRITELLPNAVGSDTGNEFIELYNPNDKGDISLKGYKVAVGPALEKVIILTEYVLKAGEYKVFTNAELGFSFLNTSSRVTLFSPTGEIISEVPVYTSPSEGDSWALVDDRWQYTSQPTPGSVNVAVVSNDAAEDSSSNTIPATTKACAANQYRSPETNRCRLMNSAAVTSPTPCKIGQERNPETNRCRNVTTATSTTCKEGQEKNPETNRCRTIKQLSSVGYGVKGATTQQQGGMGWYMWAAIAGIALLIVGYGVWEWREELTKLFQVIKAKFAGKVN